MVLRMKGSRNEDENGSARSVTLDRVIVYRGHNLFDVEDHNDGKLSK